MRGRNWSEEELADLERKGVRVLSRQHPAPPQDAQGARPETSGDGAMGGDRGANAPASLQTSRSPSAPFTEGAAARVRSGAPEGGAPPVRPVRQHTEDDLQVQVAEFLDWALPEPYRWLHVPNGGKRARIEAARLKAMGVKAGAADVLIFCPLPNHLKLITRDGMMPAGVRVVWIELKSETGRLTEEQETWRDWCHLTGTPWFCCRSLDEVIEACREVGIPLKARAA